VTGVDIEPSAIELAKKRAIGNKNTKFFVADIEKDKLPCLEKFDMIYSIGNVFSHVSKDHIFEVLLQIMWKRKIDEKTGRISMDGIFLESGCIQHFDVWGYTVAEITGMLNSLGFVNIEFSEKLDFIAKNKTKNPISLYFRATRI
jgi:SAM-dependent methyltransferase